VSISKGSTGNKSYTANWNINSYTITVNNGTGGGTYNYGATATIKANANSSSTSGYNNTSSCTASTVNSTRYKTKTDTTFSKWSDGNTSSSRNITVTGNATYTAQFNTTRTNVDTQTCKKTGTVYHPYSSIWVRQKGTRAADTWTTPVEVTCGSTGGTAMTFKYTCSTTNFQSTVEIKEVSDVREKKWEIYPDRSSVGQNGSNSTSDKRLANGTLKNSTAIGVTITNPSYTDSYNWQ
jgi:hypothetical protein